MGLKTEKIGVRVSPEEKKKLEKICEERDIPMAQLIREFIKRGLANE